MMGACMRVLPARSDRPGRPSPTSASSFSEETDWQYRLREAGWKVVFSRGRVRTSAAGRTLAASIGEPARALRFFAKHRGPREAERRVDCCWWPCGCEARSSVASAGGYRDLDLAGLRERPTASGMTNIALYFRLLRDGRRPRAGVGAGRARRVEHRGHPGLVADADLRGTRGDVRGARPGPSRRRSPCSPSRAPLLWPRSSCARRPARESIPWRWAAAGAGAALGILLWRVAGTVQGDGLFHLARTRKLLEARRAIAEGSGRVCGREPASRLRLPSRSGTASSR